ncbi:MAG: tRNA (N6-threonylcarbamoyladenosine(37)-N6)-methyltransferase TrmO [Candidatus Odinarchaeota archaeon]
MLEVQEIGVVKNKFLVSEDPFKMRKETSTIIIHDKYEEGLYKIDNIEYLQVLFYFHKSEGCTELIGPTYSGETKGVFASRSQHRPSSIGLTTVKNLGREGRELRVEGLDAIDGTPVIDIKPFTLTMDNYEKERMKKESTIKYPRIEIMKLIRNWNLKVLLKKAAKLHGHYCPGLAFGVMAGAYMIKEMGWKTDGMEKVLVITETNNCSVDGIQFTTGCSLGNNALIFRDLGKTAFTFINRNGEGIRLSLKANSKESYMENTEYFELFEKIIKKRKGTDEDMEKFKNLAQEMSFKIIELEVETLFKIENILHKTVPEYAPINENIICSNCQENTMMNRAIKKNGEFLCISCADADFFELNGFGIQKVKNGSSK